MQRGSSLRIIAGERRGFVLRAPQGPATRPTLGRVRESLFMILHPDLPDARVLDVCAGSGALGLEALSRGARHATFIEQARPALAALEENIQRLAWAERTHVVPHEALGVLKRPGPPAGEAPYDLILLDPPYAQGLADAALAHLGAALDAWLAPEGQVVAQVGERDPLAPAYGPLVALREKTYGVTRVVFFARQP